MVAAGRHWRSAAACQFADADLFFPATSPGLSVKQEAEAKKVCAQCQVQAECLAFALRTCQVHGVWGGMSEQERHLLRRRDGRSTDPGTDHCASRHMSPPRPTDDESLPCG